VARNPRSDDESPSIAGTLNDTITKAFQKRLGIEREIYRLTELHLKPLKDKRTELMRALKSDTTIAGKDASLFFKVWRRQQDALEVLEEEDREKILDDMRSLFHALAAGEMLDFIDVLGSANHQPRHLRVADAARIAAAAEDEASPFLVP